MAYDRHGEMPCPACPRSPWWPQPKKSTEDPRPVIQQKNPPQ
jgi:hypothetical protein